MFINDPLFEFKNKEITDDNLKLLSSDLKNLDSKLELYYSLQVDGTFCLGVINCPCPNKYNEITALINKYVTDPTSTVPNDLKRLMSVLKSKKLI